MRNGKPRILIVDDDERMREELSAILHTIDCVTETASSGIEAIHKSEEHPPDLILLDLLMPEMDGQEIFQTIRRNFKNRSIPVLFLTEWQRDESGLQNFNSESVDFIEKPVVPVEVIARCKAFLHLKQYEDDLESAEGVVRSLALAVEARDATSGNHCDRLFYRLVKMVDILNLDYNFKNIFLKGAMLHDIGKVGVPDSVLLKQGPLTNSEWVVMRRHTVIGEELCRPLKMLRPVLPIIRHHHERFDGTGYPDGLAGEQIPLAARIFQICDVYDALTHERPYKPAYSKVESIRILESETKKGWWDPPIVEKFIHMVQEESS